eukprot:scaffold259_cov252-Pinguiococcus_pyrenoidosus.AAC.20
MSPAHSRRLRETRRSGARGPLVSEPARRACGCVVVRSLENERDGRGTKREGSSQATSRLSGRKIPYLEGSAALVGVEVKVVEPKDAAVALLQHFAHLVGAALLKLIMEPDVLEKDGENETRSREPWVTATLVLCARRPCQDRGRIHQHLTDVQSPVRAAEDLEERVLLDDRVDATSFDGLAVVEPEVEGFRHPGLGDGRSDSGEELLPPVWRGRGALHDTLRKLRREVCQVGAAGRSR